MSHEHDWYQYPNLMLENVVTVICTLCGKIAEQRPMRRMTGLRVDPDGTRHSVWREEGAAQPHTTTRTLSGTLLAANQSAASAELKRAANRRANARYRGKKPVEPWGEQ